MWVSELFQFQDQFNSDQNITNYLRRINRKTALLIQLATEVGALTSNASDEVVRKNDWSLYWNEFPNH